jgi:hypothetical protein
MKTFIILISTITLAAAQWPPPKAPAVSGADGYVEIPNAAQQKQHLSRNF